MSVIVVLLAYPVAYFLALSGTKRKYVLLLILIAPFLTSYLLRVLAWKVILGSNGVLNSFLFWTGIRSPDDPISQLLYSKFAVDARAHLRLAAVRRAADLRVARDASTGGCWRRRLISVRDPVAGVPARDVAAQRPGVVAAFLFVFIPTVGEFVTPSLVGGTSGYMYGNQISDLFSTGFPDWRTGSVLALFLLAVVAVLTGVFSRFLGMRQGTTH